VGRLSGNGLLEINRQRIQQELRLRTHRACPTCAGTGRIASPEMVGLNLLRRIEGRAADGNIKAVRIALHPELADAFQNGRRHEIAALEDEFEIRVEIIAANRLHRPDQEIEWFDRDPADTPKARPRRRVARDLQPTVEAAELASVAEDREDEESGEKGGKRKRRRSRKRKPRGTGGGDGESAESASQPLAAAPEEGADGGETKEESAENGGAPKKRRRRRGGRGRRRTPKPDGDDGGTEAAAAG
jgi:ribonuclease E